MAEHVTAIQELKKLPEGSHIFCPRLSDDRVTPATDTDTETEAKQEQDAKQRRDLFFSALPLLAYDGEECAEYHQWLYSTLDSQLGKCEACIRRYYLAKVDFKTQLLQEYEDNEVDQFLGIIRRKDITRIKSGLDSARTKLESLPKEQRGLRTLQDKQLFAVYEALHCEAFYNSEQLLRDHFDTPFQLVQTQKELKIREILPAITKFLFSPNQDRLQWSMRTWQRLGRSPTDEEWDWAIKHILKDELAAVHDEKSLIRFWGGLRMVCDTMSNEQVKFKIFDLGFNFARMSLDHLAKPTMAVPYIAACLRVVWSKASDAYWQELPSVSAGTVAEQFFASPRFDKCLELQASQKPKNDLLDVLSWMRPFLDGLQPSNRSTAAQTLAHQLFSRVKSSHAADTVKQLCFEWAVKVLNITVLSFSEHDQVRNSTARPVLSDVLLLVSTHLPSVLSFVITGTNEERSNTRDQIMTLVRNSLALECMNLKSDYEALSHERPKTQNSSYTPDLWRTVNRHLDADHSDLSMAFLVSTMSLAGLEQFPPKSLASCKDEKESFNITFSKIEDLLSQCIDHLSEFPPEHLDPLFGNQNANMALMALLFSGNEIIYTATVELVKNIAQQPGRVEALSHVIEAFFSNTLYSICWVFRRTATMMPFSPIPRLLKTSKDILDLLCDTAGLLRNKKVEPREREAVQSYWTYSWQMLTTIFRRMEKWSLEVSDKPLMTEVCRSTMQYAQELFGHYYVFVKILEQGRTAEAADEIPKILLNTEASSSSGSPPKALDSMVKWLRLRDPYLAETLVDLIVPMLRRLKEYGTRIASDSYALSFVEEVATGAAGKGKGTKTILNQNQKALLIRALESYTGKQILNQAKLPVKKQQRLDSWTDPALKKEVKPKPEIIALDDDEDFGKPIKTEDMSDLEKAEALRKQALLAEKKEQKQQLQQRSKPVVPQKVPVLSTSEQLKLKQSASSRAFLEKRKLEEAAAKARNRELAARLRGKTGSEHTTNAGSGLAGLGVQGKDHSTPRSDLMVSSDSESESSEDDEIFGTSTKQGGVVASNHKRPSNAVSMPIRKIKQARSAKDMRARLSPDLTGLHKTILAWDFFAQTETPPNSGKDDYTLVTNTFKTVEDYQKTFEPLLVLEGWQSVRTAREDGSFKPFEVKVANSMIVDNFFEVNSTVPMAEGKELGLGPSDVVLLSKGSRPHVEPNEPHCLARVKEITRKRGEMQIVYRVNSANNPMRPHLNDKATIFAVQILSLTPLEREYGALMALPYYDLADEVIRAKPSPLLQYEDDEVQELRELHNLNTAQAKAVKSAVDNDAFTLIQGPPGSGKTKTITAILSETLTGITKTNGLLQHSRNGISLPTSAKKILVAAPSNAAVDELVMRFKDGIMVTGGRKEKINVVRLGRSEAINTAVKDVTLEELVNSRLSENAGINGGKEDIHAVMMEHKKASDDMLELKQKMDSVRQKGEQVSTEDDQLHEALRRRKTALSAKIDEMREKQNSASRDADINRRRIQQEILDNAHVLCATLSGSGHEIFQGLNVEFETVIIDEAAQSIELSALIPLKYGCSKCILVGDPKQLPPTVLSRQAAKYQYEQSLFARMENNHRKDVHLLDIQYRMHPEISAFPSKTFYDSRLRDGGDMTKLRARPWHRSQIFAPYRFFDVEGMSESAPKGRSLVNNAEIEVALAMYDRLISDVPRYDFRNKIGIITPYKGQLKALKQRFSMRYGESIWSAIDFNTTDAFQGRESEIIIFSCVRASTQGIGFLNDVRRMNVGLTRAKCSLWVLGNSQSLIQGEFWRALVKDAKERSLYTSDNVRKLFDRPLLTAQMMIDDVEMGGMDEISYSSTMSNVDNSASTTDASTSKVATGFGARVLTDKEDDKSSKQPSTAPTPEGRFSDEQDVSNSERVSGEPKQHLSRTSSSTDAKPTKSASATLSRQSSTGSINASKSDAEKFRVKSTNAKKDQNDAKNTPPQRHGVNGPSGGRYGLNAKVNCTICGSDQHFSHNCDNEKAQEASLGLCSRCGKTGHTELSCKAIRCLECGEIGHVGSSCTVAQSRRLNMKEKEELKREEEYHEKTLQRNREKMAKKQLGEHAVSIPAVKSGTENVDGKRKRSPEASKRQSKAPKIDAGDQSVSLRSDGGAQIRSTGSMGPKSGVPGPAGAPMIRKKIRDDNSMFAKKR